MSRILILKYLLIFHKTDKKGVGITKHWASYFTKSSLSKVILLLISIISGLVFFQNCSGNNFNSNSLAPIDSSSNSSSNTNEPPNTDPNSVSNSPVITEQPQSANLVAGTTVAFRVVASGANPKFYQWKHNGNLLLGANSDALTIPNLVTANEGSYQVEVTNAAGKVSSVPAILNVLSPPVITQQPASVTAVLGGSSFFSIGVRGTSPFTFQWKKNNVNIVGGTSPTLNLSNIQTADAGSYSVVISNAVGSATSNVANLQVNSPIVILTQPVSQNINLGGSVNFSVSVSGTAPLSYQWKKNGTNIGGAVNNNFTIANVQTSAEGNYSVTITNPVGSVTSQAARLGVNVAPFIMTQPDGMTLNVGGNASFSVSVSGTTPISYQWKKNGVNIAGANTSILNLTNVQTNDQADYSLVATNVAGTITSNNAALVVNVETPGTVAPSFILQPQAQTLNQGGTAQFSVSVAGTNPMSFQWRKDGVNITGANSATYSISNVQASTHAGLYSVFVSNSAGSVTSSAALLTINTLPIVTTTAPIILTQPLSQSVNVGNNVSFSVSVSGTTPISYQWKKNGVDVAGANNSTFNLTNVQISDGANYSVLVSNSIGNTLSNNAILNVVAPDVPVIPPSISAQPNSQTVVQGQSANFNVVATGTAPFNYQWKKNGTNILGANSASYSINITNASNSGQYTVTISNSSGSVTSNAAELIVQIPVSITSQPVPINGEVGGSASFSVFVNGTSPFTYQWRKNGNPISGANTANYTINNIQTIDLGNYSVVVSNPVNSVTSNAVSLTLESAPIITSQPIAVTVVEGAPATFTVTATGSNPLNYQWRKNGNNISGANLPTYTINATNAGNIGQYSVEVSNSMGSVVSNNAQLNVLSAPVIVTQPQSFTINLGSPFTLSVVANSIQTLSYQWKKNGVNIAGAILSQYNVNTAELNNAGFYTVQVSNSVGQVTSEAAEVIVNAAPTITSQPVGVTVTAGSNTSLSVTATSSQYLNYQWQKEGTAIPEATNATLSLPNISVQDAGNYNVLVSNNLGSVLSKTVAVNVNYPTLPAGLASFTTIDAGLTMFCGIAPEKYVYCWGSNTAGLGDGVHTNSNEAIAVPIYNAKAITVGGEHACALTETGEVYCWGNNNRGQLGTNVLLTSSTPVRVLNIPAAILITAGSRHSCAYTVSGLYCWGDNIYGQLGIGTSNNYQTLPVKVNTSVGTPMDITAGNDHTCAIGTEAASLYCWGASTYCQLGNGATTTTMFCTGSLIPLKTNFNIAGSKVSAGHSSTGIISFNYYYHMGMYGVKDSKSFTVDGQVVGKLANVAEVEEGLTSRYVYISHAGNVLMPYRCFRFANGSVSCVDTGLNSITQYSVTAISNARNIAVGTSRACALNSSNQVSCWNLPNLNASALYRK